MTQRVFFANQAQPEEQGSFTDRASKITYCNESKTETLNHAAMTEEHGGMTDMRYDYDVGDPNRLPEDTRFNTTVLELDPLGFEYPARYEPGR
ncbi:hypothetical protein ACN4EG_21245 [Alkalinema pantanalense CENA528]|uniref:hypothetical protein n=1 Tax=Alkalinema pantanalense TaxID=1620705 RepID=UPI003D6FADE1